MPYPEDFNPPVPQAGGWSASTSVPQAFPMPPGMTQSSDGSFYSSPDSTTMFGGRGQDIGQMKAVPTTRERLYQEMSGQPFNDVPTFLASFDRHVRQEMIDHGIDPASDRGKELYKNELEQAKARAGEFVSPVSKDRFIKVNDDEGRQGMFDVQTQKYIWDKGGEAQALPPGFNIPPPMASAAPSAPQPPVAPTGGAMDLRTASPESLQDQISEVGNQLIALTQKEYPRGKSGERQRLDDQNKIKALKERASILEGAYQQKLPRRKQQLSESGQNNLLRDAEGLNIDTNKFFDEKEQTYNWTGLSKEIGREKQFVAEKSGAVGKEYRTLQDAENLFNAMMATYEDLTKQGVTGMKVGTAKAKIENLVSGGKYYPKMQAYQNLVAGLAGQLKGFVGESGVLTQQDIERMQRLLASPFTDPAAAKEQFSFLKDRIEQLKSTRLAGLPQHQARMGVAQPAPSGGAKGTLTIVTSAGKWTGVKDTPENKKRAQLGGATITVE